MNAGRNLISGPFAVFLIVMATTTATMVTRMEGAHAFLLGFTIAAASFLVANAPLLSQKSAERMRSQARRNDANPTVLIAVTVAVMAAVLVVVGTVMRARADTGDIALSIVSLALAWLFVNVVYTLRYAHLYYGDADADARDDEGLVFTGNPEPDYWEFLYFGFSVGMTFQTADVQVTSRQMRRTVLGHAMAAFVFNIGVVAFTVNVLSG